MKQMRITTDGQTLGEIAVEHEALECAKEEAVRATRRLMHWYHGQPTSPVD